jgi:hypothetical protein
MHFEAELRGFKLKLTEHDWKNYYLLPHKLTKETKLRIMQLKILHKILPTNKWLFKCNMETTSNCTFCQINIETIDQLLWDCNYSKNIWLKLAEHLHRTNLTPKINFNKENTLLGDITSPPFLEQLKLITKEFLYINKMNKETPVFESLIQKIKYRIKLEKTYTSETSFRKKWEKEFQSMLYTFNCSITVYTILLDLQ